MMTDEQIIDIYQDHYSDDDNTDPAHIVPFARALLSASKPAVALEVAAWRRPNGDLYQENPNGFTDWTPLYEHPAVPAQLRDAQDERTDALCDSSYCAGLQQGFTFGQQDDNEGLHKALAARDGYVKVLREAPAPAQSGEPVARVAGTKTLYVDCHECVECGHIGINDSHPTDASCGYSCDWTGPSPVDDKCPGCQREGVMGLACPKCSGRYNILAEAHISYAALQPAQTAQSAVGLDDERAPVIGLLKRARYVRHEDLPADVRDETETRAAYGNSAAWQDARNHEQRRLIDEALSRLEVLATSPQSGQTEQALKAQLNAAYAALDAVADWAKQEGADDDMEAGTRLLALLLKHGVHPRETLAVQPASGGQ
jgi:hypothetical protein